MNIWKFPIEIEHRTSINAPRGAKIIHVGLDPAGTPCAWAECEPLNAKEEIKLCVVGTGQTKPDEATAHIGSFIHGPFIWHIYFR